MPLTKNRGEWGELYAFSKLLCDGSIAFISDNNNDPSSSVNITEITRKEGARKGRYALKTDLGQVSIQNDAESDITPRLVPVSGLRSKIREVFVAIRDGHGASFTNLPAEEFMGFLGTTIVSANSHGIDDFKLRLGETYMGKLELGFSVKTMIGGSPTLFNASAENTNFKFEITGPTRSLDISRINLIVSQKQRLSEILESGCEFKPEGPTQIFGDSLRLIGQEVPTLLSALLFGFYGGWGNKLSDLIRDERVLNLHKKWSGETVPSDTLKYRLKGLILEMALGLHAASPWSGSGEIDGGIILVRPDGEIEGYIARSINLLKDHLLGTTKFEAPSRTRHKYGVVYVENGRYFMKLNLQIRFIR